MAYNAEVLLAEARKILPKIVQLRRLIHRRPEVGLTLPHTQSAIIEAVGDLDLQITTGKQLSSVVAVLEGRSPGQTVLLRADMDALKIREATGLDYASEIEGAMHACGHDAHTAMLVGAACLLALHKEQIAGRVIFAFQPGEEGFAGARLMIEEGLLDRYGTPDAAFAIHITPRQPSGVVFSRPGPTLAGAGTFKIVIKGRAGHPAEPHNALDPIPVASEVVLALQTYVTRRVKAFEPAVVTVTAIQAGSPELGAIPETATLAGTIRAVSEETRIQLFGAIRELAMNIASAHGAEAEVIIEPGYPPLVNDPLIVEVIGEVSRGLLGKDHFRLLPTPIMPSEDFSYILQRIPGAMAFLGARPDHQDPVADVHSPRMVLNEDAMAVGTALHAAMALRLLDR
ncbi:MAG TPA: M20 family metallopeptidase [Candidatus Binatia bacterium]|nr:M20 family metallopeptidase [Candidatus Binatia bacterium]